MHGLRRSHSRIVPPTRTHSCRIFMKCAVRQRQQQRELTRGERWPQRAKRGTSPGSILPTPCSSPPCSSLLARRGSLNSHACGFLLLFSAWRCSFLPSSECSLCLRPNELSFLILQNQTHS